MTNVFKSMHNVIENNPELLTTLFTQQALIFCMKDLENKMKEYFGHIKLLEERLLLPFEYQSQEEHNKQLISINLHVLLTYYKLYKKYESVVELEKLVYETDFNISNIEMKLLMESKLETFITVL